MEAQALAPGLHGGKQDHHAGDGRDHPAPVRPDRTIGAAAEQLEIVVDQRNGLALGHRPGGAAPDQQAAQRDDEGGHAEIGDDEAVQRADQRAGEDAGDQREDDDGGAVEAEGRHQIARLEHRHDHAGDAEDRAHRQVDVAHHDDQHHAGRHHGDGGGLDREVPQIARRQEGAVGEEVEHHPDGGERPDHAEEADVDFHRTKERALRSLRRGRGHRRAGRRCLAHKRAPEARQRHAAGR